MIRRIQIGSKNGALILLRIEFLAFIPNADQQNLGIVNRKSFMSNIPERRTEWTGNVPAQYDLEKYILERYGINVRRYR